jgi:hypothetical protein
MLNNFVENADASHEVVVYACGVCAVATVTVTESPSATNRAYRAVLRSVQYRHVSWLRRGELG